MGSTDGLLARGIIGSPLGMIAARSSASTNGEPDVNRVPQKKEENTLRAPSHPPHHTPKNTSTTKYTNKIYSFITTTTNYRPKRS